MKTPNPDGVAVETQNFASLHRPAIYPNLVFSSNKKYIWRGARVVESGALEKR